MKSYPLRVTKFITCQLINYSFETQLCLETKFFLKQLVQLYITFEPNIKTFKYVQILQTSESTNADYTTFCQFLIYVTIAKYNYRSYLSIYTALVKHELFSYSRVFRFSLSIDQHCIIILRYVWVVVKFSSFVDNPVYNICKVYATNRKQNMSE